MESCETLLSAEGKAASRDRTIVPSVGRAFHVTAKLCFFAFILFTSTYCLLAYVPFTYQWVIRFDLVGWLPTFVKFHPYFYWLVLGIVAGTLGSDLRREETRRLAAGFLLFHAAVGVGLVLHPVLSGIQNDSASFVWSLVWLFPIFWLGAIDFSGEFKEIRWSAAAGQERNLPLAALLAAAFVWSLNAGLFYLRLPGDGSQHFGRLEQIVAMSWSAGSHLFIFALFFLALKLAGFISTKFSRGARVEYLLCHLVAVAFCALLIRKVILPAIAFNNRLADVFSMVAGTAIVVFFLGLGLRLNRRSEEKDTRGLQLALTPLTLPGLSSILGRLLWAALVALFAWAVSSAVATRDWDFLLQKLCAVAIWPITFAAFCRITLRVKNEHQYYLVALLLVSGGSAYRSVDWLQSRWSLGGDAINVSATLERYSAYDLSFRVVRDVFSISTDDDSLYDHLREYTNILPSTRVAPVEIKLVNQLKRTQDSRPNIFFFVIDSLRRDYLSPYNETVSFTPNIDRFARESVVMKNAFTRYGGTALSEPAIWSGAMLLHKQYVLPFYPMNALQKLLDADQYQSFISMDPILSELLRPSPSIVALDKRGDGHDFDLCWSLKELERNLDERKPSEPLFVYTQPWNIHAHVIATEGITVPAGEEYPRFWAPYASRVKYMDACFGEFIGYLKERGLYENSIVILTSDHGDSLGEDGRWGHSYWMFPEIIRIPLIIHLPDKLKAGLVWDPEAAAFSTDITPSLYYLLGHRPIVRNGLFGRPLFTATQQEQREYLQAASVVASSYGAVYGVVSGNGRWLFLADAVRNRDYFYDLAGEGRGSLDNFTTAKRAEQQQLIREYIGSINQLYGLKEKPQTAGAFDMGRQGRAAGEE